MQAMFQQPKHPWPFLNAPKFADVTTTTADNTATARLPRAVFFGGLADSPVVTPGSSQRVRGSIVEVIASATVVPVTRYDSITLQDFQQVRV